MNNRYTYDPISRRFRSTTDGRYVAWAEVRASLDRAIDTSKAGINDMTERLRSGQMSLADWQRGMEREIKSIHLASYAVERGGWQQLSQADYGRVGNILFNPNGTRENGALGQYQYLRDMVRDIASGKQALDGTLLRRAKLYGEAGRATYHKAQRVQVQALGFDEERFVLVPADHCQTDTKRGTMGCVERAAAGWQLIGTLPGIGFATCHVNDRCDQQFRNTATGEIWPTR